MGQAAYHRMGAMALSVDRVSSTALYRTVAGILDDGLAQNTQRLEDGSLLDERPAKGCDGR